MSRLYVIHDRQCEIIDIGLELTIGRSYSNRLRIEGPDASRAHAIIYRRGDEFIVRDLDSKNGISINDKRQGKRVLKPGDRITISTYTLIFDPPEPVDLSAWLSEDQQVEAREGVNDTLVQKTHQHCPPEIIEKSFADSQITEDISIARAGLSLRFAHQIITRLLDDSTQEAVCKSALDWAIELFAAHRGMVSFRKCVDDKPHTVAIFDLKDKGAILIHQRILEWLQKGEAVISVESSDDVVTEDSKSLSRAYRIAMPLAIGEKSFGFIYLESDPPVAPFAIDDLQRLFCLARVTSRRLEELE